MSGANSEMVEPLVPDTQVVEGETKVVEPAPPGEPTDVVEEPKVEAEGEAEPAKKPIQPRINELVRKQREAEREVAYWKGVAEAATRKEAPPPPAPPAKPTADQFNTYDEYVEALTGWKAEQIVSAQLAESKAQEQKRTSEQSAAQRAKSDAEVWQTRQAETRAQLADYDEVVGESEVPVERHVAEILTKSPFGPRLAYELAKNPELAAEVNGMPQVEAAMRLAEVALPFRKTAPAPVHSTSLSKAPTPPRPVTAAGAAASKDLGRMSMDEYVAARKAQGAAWGR